MRIMYVPDTVFNLEELHRQFGGSLYLGRPEMLLLRMSNGRNVQLHRQGAIQILGRVRQQEAQAMRREVLQQLQIRNASPLVIVNIVIRAQLMKKKVCLRKINDTNVFYETEIFPAALIDKWKPAHVSVFHNGKLVLTGVRTVEKCYEILSSLIHFLNEK